MINKKLDKIEAILETIKVLVQDNEYLENVDKRCDEVNKQYTQALEVAQDRYDRIQKAIEYIENEMPYLEEPDEEIERCDGAIYMTTKEYDKNILLDILKGGKDE